MKIICNMYFTKLLILTSALMALKKSLRVNKAWLLVREEFLEVVMTVKSLF